MMTGTKTIHIRHLLFKPAIDAGHKKAFIKNEGSKYIKDA